MIDMQELKKKLALWARFWYDTTQTRGYVHDMGWVRPDGWNIGERITDLPNFPESLDACFKWLMPEYEKRYGIYAKASLMSEWLNLYENTPEYKNKPALALCVAISKLIEQEVDKVK